MSATLHTSDTELSTGNDPYLWLEDITSERSLAWVREQNAATVRELGASGDFETAPTPVGDLHPKNAFPMSTNMVLLLQLLAGRDPCARVVATNDAGRVQKADPAWETVLDLDQLAERPKTRELGLPA